MKLAILGATGKTGRCLVELAIGLGHEVTALVRRPVAGDLPAAVRVVQGDVREPARVAEVIAGNEAVLSCLGAALRTSRGPQGKVSADATPAILGAMKQHSVRRLITLSALGAGEAKPQMSVMFRIIMATVLKGIYADKNAMEPLIRASDVDWTIVRPTNLTNGKRTGQIAVDPPKKLGISSRIARRDVADFMLQIVSDPSYFRRTVTITRKK